MVTGLGGAAVVPGVAKGPVGPRGAKTMEAVLPIFTCAPVQAGVRVALVYLHVTLLP